MNYQKHLLIKRIIAIISIVIFLTICIFLTVYFWNFFSNKSNSISSLKNTINSFGWKAPVIFLLIHMLQVFLALLPGEIIELAAGVCFGPIGGTILCLIGCFSSSLLILLLYKFFGQKIVSLFVDSKKIERLNFINTSKKRNILVFILYLIPGTPKDLFTYFIPLTGISIPNFLIISLIARIPSIISSTICGSLFINEQYILGGLVLFITLMLSIAGLVLYNKIEEKNNKKSGTD